MKNRLEVRTTISPTPFFFRRIHFMAASLREVCGTQMNHELVVSVGGGDGTENFYRSQPWSSCYPLIWRQVPVEAYARLGYRATNRDRAAHMSRAEFVMMADADVIFLRDFSGLLRELEAAPAICGVMAHASPFAAPPKLMPALAGRIPETPTQEDYWRLLTGHYGVPDLKPEYEYSGWQVMNHNPDFRYAPAYFNGGMVLGPSALMEKMCELYASAEEAVDDVMDTYFRPQLARTLAIHKAGLPVRSLPVKFNFPNDSGFDVRYADQIDQIQVLQYLRREIIDRDRDFMDQAGVDRLLSRRDLAGSNEALRKRIAELRDVVFAEEDGAGFAGVPRTQN